MTLQQLHQVITIAESRSMNEASRKLFVSQPNLSAVVRELEEETGYASEHLEPLISIVTAIAFCDEVIDIYLATGLKKTQQHLDEDEYIDVYAYTPQELADMIYSGKIQDSKTVAAIMAYINRK